MKIGKEAKTLLKIIGTDEEVGTHGAVSKYMVLALAIKNKKDIYDSSDIASKACSIPPRPIMSLLSPLSSDKEAYCQAIIELVPFLNQMSETAFSRLVTFAEFLDLHLDYRIGKAIKDNCALPSWCEEQIKKRAIFLQTFSRLKPQLYTIEELDGEKKVKEKHPWQWIDAVFYNYPERAQIEIIYQITKNQDITSLALRIPTIINEMPHDYLDGIIDGIKDKIPKERLGKLEESISGYRNVNKK